MFIETLMWDPPNVTNHYGSQGESHISDEQYINMQ